MAKIIRTTNQETALRGIIRDLKTLNCINAAMRVFETMDGAAEFSVSFAAGRTKAVIPVPAAEAIPMLIGMRDKIRSGVEKSASKFSIELDERDSAILHDRRDAEVPGAGGDVVSIPGADDSDDDGMFNSADTDGDYDDDPAGAADFLIDDNGRMAGVLR